MVFKVESNKECIDPTIEYIAEIKNKLTEKQINEFAQEYDLTFEEAKDGLAEYIAWHMINN